MCAYCDKKDTCDCRCDKNTDVIWGEITGELKDQTDLQAALDKHTADILTADTLAHSNEQRLDAVEGTANEANQRSKDNLTRLDSVDGMAKTTKALADVHTTRLNNVEGVANGANTRSQDNMKRLDRVEGVANGANTRSQDNMKRLDRVEGVANGAQALANNHTELINKVEDTAGTALQTAQLAQNVGNEALDGIETLTSEIAGLKTRIEALEAKVNTNQSADNA
jgi:chromosome segregation ATPase